MPLFRDQTASPYDEQGRLRLECWYCGLTIKYEAPDPCAVVLVANWGDAEAEREQQFFAHAECFRRSGSGQYLEILDPDSDDD
jgi:hypothetical protein